MTKIRLIRTMVLEYTPNPEHYPTGLTIKEMAELDASQNPEDIFGEYCEPTSDTLRYEISNEERPCS